MTSQRFNVYKNHRAYITFISLYNIAAFKYFQYYRTKIDTGGLLASDQLRDNIFHFNMQTGEEKSMMSIENEILGGMDFDYIGNNLYLSDVKHKTIEVHSLNNNEKTIFYFQDEPYDIALVPEEK